MRRPRAKASGEPPPSGPYSARGGLERLHDLARLLVDREESEEPVSADLARTGDPRPNREAPAPVWSVDLALRHLPSLSRLALAFVRDDPVVLEIERLAREWPLSGVTRSIRSLSNHWFLTRRSSSRWFRSFDGCTGIAPISQRPPDIHEV